MDKVKKYVTKNKKATNLSNKSSSQWLESLEKVYDFDIIICKVKESVKRANKKKTVI